MHGYTFPTSIEEMLELIHTVHERKPTDGFTQSLSQQFDELMARMNQPDAARATEAALFVDPAARNKAYHPDVTETKT